MLAILFLVAFSASAFAEGVLIRCERPCAAAKAAVERAGGQVTIEYRYINAIAADVPDRAFATLSATLPAGSVGKDVIVHLPSAVVGRDGGVEDLQVAISDEDAQALGLADIAALGEVSPDSNGANNGLININALHAAGMTGGGVKVAVIDSGLRGGPLFTFGGVFGGENFVPGQGASSWNQPSNSTHGSFVAGMIGNRFAVTPPAPWAAAFANHCGAPCMASPTAVYMIGSAPASQVYALRVFAATGGSPRSRILQAGEHVITLRQNYENGIAETVDATGRAAAANLKVCNMSLGGPTTQAAGDLYEELAQAMLANDIVLVTSAGNAGPGGSTGGSPGTSTAAIAVGAASTAMHERILRDLQFGAGIGVAYRPTTHTQTAYFSSRGPTADGRNSPHVTANGFASFSHTGTGLSFGSGTSYSGPTVAGVAAVLRQAHPSATARQIRNAIVMGANPNVLGDNSEVNDQGAGFVDALASSSLLAGGAVPDTLPSAGPKNRNVNVNVVRGADIRIETGSVSKAATLVPGERFETYYKVNPNTAAVVVTLSDVVPGANQNPRFGDDFIMAIHSAKTSAHGGSGDYKTFAFTTGGTWVIPYPETGLMRVTALGDWTNASPISGTVTITSISEPEKGNLSQAKIVEGDMVEVQFIVPAGVGQLAAQLEWPGDWGAYPTNDVDLYLIRPNGTVINSGATSNAPERVVVANPAAGTWTALVHGFTISNDDERYNLTVNVDGKPARRN